MLSTGGINFRTRPAGPCRGKTKIVKKSGSWFSYGETRLGQGRDRSKAVLEENPELCLEIKQKVLEAQGLVASTEEELEPETEPEAVEA